MKFYHLVSIHQKTQRKSYLTRYARPHDTACAMLKRFTLHPLRIVMLEQV